MTASAMLVRDTDVRTPCDLDGGWAPRGPGGPTTPCALDLPAAPGVVAAADRPTALAPATTDVAAQGIPLRELWTGRAGQLRVCRAVGRALAELHRHPVRAGQRTAALPSLLSGELPTGATGAVRDALADPTVRRAVRVVERGWTAEGWVHGDVRLDDLWVDTGVGRCRAKECRVRLIDRGGAGVGPAAWDLAGVVDALITAARTWDLRVPTALAAFGEGYRHAGGTGRPRAAEACAMALHRAACPTTPPDDVPQLVARAHRAAGLVRAEQGVGIR
ncbi:phosphotransferase [Euzebya sp.]|uniref:phosphotransferase n=1 Tax=Euzebya sp. TaxID=1971409 RepID=UPI0035118980